MEEAVRLLKEVEGIDEGHLHLPVLEVAQARQQVQDDHIPRYQSAWEHRVLEILRSLLQHLGRMALQMA